MNATSFKTFFIIALVGNVSVAMTSHAQALYGCSAKDQQLIEGHAQTLAQNIKNGQSHLNTYQLGKQMGSHLSPECRLATGLYIAAVERAAVQQVLGGQLQQLNNRLGTTPSLMPIPDVYPNTTGVLPGGAYYSPYQGLTVPDVSFPMTE